LTATSEFDSSGSDYAGLSILPLSSDMNVLPNVKTRIRTRRQLGVAFRPVHMIIDEFPGNWVVHDVAIGNRSQFLMSGDVSGATFSASFVSKMRFETVFPAMDVYMDVTYVGPRVDGAPFLCSMLGEIEEARPSSVRVHVGGLLSPDQVSELVDRARAHVIPPMVASAKVVSPSPGVTCDGMRLLECRLQYANWQRFDPGHPDHDLCKPMTPAQKAAASASWSAELRARIAASAEVARVAERDRVCVDQDDDFLANAADE
jgi:hypothetical protein